MELFHEMYGRYFAVTAEVLARAHESELTRKQLEEIVASKGFAESGLHLLPRLIAEEWGVLQQTETGYDSKLENADTTLPLTAVQQAWLKAILQDERIRLFCTEAQIASAERRLQGVQPLFCAQQFCLFDKAADADPYADEGYRERFRLAVWAIKERAAVRVVYTTAEGRSDEKRVWPKRMQYSQKDDKFRLMALTDEAAQVVLNMGRVTGLELAQTLESAPEGVRAETKKSVTLAVYTERNALERSMLQFAAYEKRTKFDETKGRYVCELVYPAQDEAEIVVRILSFGPLVQVLEPAEMRRSLRQRIQRQQRLLAGDVGEYANFLKKV